MEGLELTAFQIISAVGTARSSYIEAIRAAKSGDFDGAKKLIKEGDEMFVEGHNAHAGLLEKEANNEVGPLGLLMVHAEDQLMSAEAFKTIALEFIDSYERIEKLEAKVKELEKYPPSSVPLPEGAVSEADWGSSRMILPNKSRVIF